MDKEIIIEKIKSYCEGKLNLEEQQSFEAKLKENPDLQTAYESYLATQEVLDHLSIQSLKTILNESVKEEPAVKRVRLIPNWWKMAASVLLLIIAGVFIYQQLTPSYHTLADNAFINPITIYPELSAERNGTAANQSWQEVLINFQNNNFEVVIATLEKNLKLNPKENFLLAHSYYKNNQLTAAKQSIEKIPLESTDYKASIDWLNILILIKEKNIESAKNQLHQIIEQSPSPIFQKRATDLLRALE